MNGAMFYVLTIPDAPKMVKLGVKGREVETFLNDLHTTGITLLFDCAYAARFVCMDNVERAFHDEALRSVDDDQNMEKEMDALNRVLLTPPSK